MKLLRRAENQLLQFLLRQFRWRRTKTRAELRVQVDEETDAIRLWKAKSFLLSQLPSIKVRRYLLVYWLLDADSQRSNAKLTNEEEGIIERSKSLARLAFVFLVLR